MLPGPWGSEMFSTSGAFGNRLQMLRAADVLLEAAALPPPASESALVQRGTKAVGRAGFVLSHKPHKPQL